MCIWWTAFQIPPEEPNDMFYVIVCSCFLVGKQHPATIFGCLIPELNNNATRLESELIEIESMSCLIFLVSLHRLFSLQDMVRSLFFLCIQYNILC